MTLTPQHCPIPSDGQCFERVVSGATVRGCKGLLDAASCRNNATLCTITSGSGSNKQVIPANRRLCYHCDGKVEATCSEKPSNGTLTLPCKKFSQPENCLKLEMNNSGLYSTKVQRKVSFLKNKINFCFVVFRGCRSDFSADICQLGSCFECNEDGCNHSSIVTINVLLCFFSSVMAVLSSIVTSS